MYKINLNKGDVYWRMNTYLNSIERYEYLYPFLDVNGKKTGYHIVINRNTQKPERIWEGDLPCELSSYEQEKAKLIKHLEEIIQYLKEN